MAGRVREKKLFIEIGGSGRLRPSAAATNNLAMAPGVWRLVPAMGRLMVLERAWWTIEQLVQWRVAETLEKLPHLGEA